MTTKSIFARSGTFEDETTSGKDESLVKPAIKVNVVVASVVAEPLGEQRMSLENKHALVFYLFQLTADILKTRFPDVSQQAFVVEHFGIIPDGSCRCSGHDDRAE